MKGFKRGVLQAFAILVVYLTCMIPVSFAASFGINQLQVTDVTHNSAVVSFNTGSVPTDGRVFYGTTGDTPNYVIDFNNPTTNHVISLEGLKENTRYYYAANASTATETHELRYQNAVLDKLYFTTSKKPDSENPIITGDVKLSLPSDDSADFTWETNEHSDTQIWWGLTDSLEFNTTNSAYVTKHSIKIDELVLDQRYYYQARSCDQYNNCQQSEVQSFIAGQDSTPPTIDVFLPEKWGQTSITFNGQTEPNAYIKLYHGEKWISQAVSNDYGNFTFHHLSLAGYGESATFRFVAIDQVGLTGETTATVEINFVPPTLTVNDIPNQNLSTNVAITGEVDQLSDISIKVSSFMDMIQPAKVRGLSNVTTQTNSVTLEWDGVSDLDVYEYLIYRDGTLIASTSGTQFVDVGAYIASGETYVYEVSAVDDSCNEGTKSDPITVTTLVGGSQTTRVDPPAANSTCDSYDYTKKFKVSGSFTETVPLQQGVNYIEVTAVNEYGNKDKWDTSLGVDTVKPVITSANFDQLTPSYDRIVDIEGTVSEAATIYLYMNGESNPSKSVDVKSAGKFKIQATLSRDARLSIEEDGVDTKISASAATSWLNQVKLVAVDDNGQASAPVAGEIEFSMCSKGIWFSVVAEEPTAILRPRLLIEGMESIGMNLNVDWQGGTLYNATIRNVYVDARSLSLDERDSWDSDWITADYSGTYPPLHDYAGYNDYGEQDRSKWRGYVNLRIPAMDPTSDGESELTMAEKEEIVSSHNQDNCTNPITGCIRYPMLVTVEFQQNHNNITQEQRTCIDVEVPIEPRIPPDYIPEDFLKDAVEFLNGTIMLIEDVLGPLSTVTEYTIYSCLAMTGVDFLLQVYEGWRCDFSRLATYMNTLTGDSDGFSMAAAQTGSCELYGLNGNPCDDDEDDTACEACFQCQDAIEIRVEFEEKMKWVCDRVYCPSAPTFQKFVQDSRKGGAAELGELAKLTSSENYETYNNKVAEFIAKNRDGLKSFDSGTMSYDCAFENLYDGNGNFPSDINGYLSAYATSDDLNSNAEEYCSDLMRTPRPECCKQAYEDKWDSACVFMDEFKESACLYAQNTNTPSYIEGPDGEKEKCNVVWNSVAGFCEPDGGAKPDIIRTGLALKPACITGGGVYTQFVNERIDQELYFRVFKPQEGTDQTKYLVEPGYLSNNINTALDSSDGIEKGEDSIINSQAVFKPLLENGNCNFKDFSAFFEINSEENKAENRAKDKAEEYNYKGFLENLAQVSCTSVVKDIDRGTLSYADYTKNSDRLTEIQKALDDTDNPIEGDEREKLLAEKANLNDKNGQAIDFARHNNQKSELVLEEEKLEESIANYNTQIVALEAQTPQDAVKISELKKERNADEVQLKKVSNKLQLLYQQEDLTTFDADIKISPTEGANCRKDESLSADKPDDLQFSKELHTNIRNSLGITAKEYVVNPVSSIWRSMQCACLPAVKSYLTLIKNMAGVIMNCFQTILLTGDGSEGMCRSVISMYVCDLLFDIIQCFMEKYSATNTGGSLEFGFGNVLGAVTQATNKVTDTVQGRYGNTNLYNAMIGQNKLVHGLCMFAFTGTWDLDMGGGLFESEYSTPVASQGMVYPCERTFHSYKQDDHGYGVWSYRVGSGIVAGADLSYQLELVCSKDMTCDPQEGFANGWCDCFDKESEQTRVIAQGQMDQYDSWEYESLDPPQVGSVRFDKARLTWSYKDNNGNTETDTVECKIDQVGGNPPAFCEFDGSDGTFSCNINSDQENWAKFTGDPIAKYAPSMNYFGIGERINIEVPVTYKAPAEDEGCTTYNCKSSKYVYFEMELPNGETIKSPAEKIEYEKPHTMILSSPTSLSLNDFSTSNGFRTATTLKGTTPIETVKCEGRLNTQTSQYLYLFIGNSGNWEYMLHYDSGLLKDSDVSALYTKYANDIKQTNYPPSSNTLNLDNGVQCSVPTNLNQYDGFKFLYNVATSDACKTKSTLVKKAKVKIITSMNKGTSYVPNYDQVEIVDGEDQIENVEINLKCSEAVDPSSEVIPLCPQPMYDGWDQSVFGAETTKCECRVEVMNNGKYETVSNYCTRGTNEQMCQPDGTCGPREVAVPICDGSSGFAGGLVLMSDWGTVENSGLSNAQCDCGNDVCVEGQGEYCVAGTCTTVPSCKKYDGKMSKTEYYKFDTTNAGFCSCGGTNLRCDATRNEVCEQDPNDNYLFKCVVKDEFKVQTTSTQTAVQTPANAGAANDVASPVPGN